MRKTLVVKKESGVKALDVMGNGKQPNDLVRTAWNMLQASADAAEAYNHAIYTADRFKHAKLTLGFLNATINSIKTSMQFVKLVSLPREVEHVARLAKQQRLGEIERMDVVPSGKSKS